VSFVAEEISTQRLLLRPWRVEDAESALAIYGEADVSRWLSPVMDSVADLAAMRLVLQQWTAEGARLLSPAGRWAIERHDDHHLVGGAILLPLPPDLIDLEMGWQLRPDAWRHGYATEAGRALARWAFGQGLDEVLAVSRPANTRAAATARRIGMEWVGETEKYYDLRLHVFRVRPGDLAHGDH
jgi:RimJ/RimL family protein N-acetyltransferase